MERFIPHRQNRRQPPPEQLRIVHIFTQFRPDFTGEGLYFEKIVSLFCAAGVTNSVVVLATVNNAKNHAGDKLRIPVRYLARSNNIGALAISLKLFKWAIVHARHYDVAHFHSHGDRYFFGKLALRLLGCRIVQSCTLDDSPTEVINGYNRRFRPIVALLMRTIDVFVVISPRLTDTALTGLARERVRFIPQGVALPPRAGQSRETERAGLGFAPEDVLLLFVGAVTERKDVAFLLEMMPRLRRADARLKLVVVGPVFDDEYGARIIARVAEPDLAGYIRLTGYTDDPGPFFRVCDIFVFASHQEGFGNVLIEAMAHRLPVVSRLLPGVTDYIISPGENGFLFSDADAYCAQVERLAADSALREAVGAAARGRVEQNFELAKIAAEYLSTYASVARWDGHRKNRGARAR